jgi:hypothetical protein
MQSSGVAEVERSGKTFTVPAGTIANWKDSLAPMLIGLREPQCDDDRPTILSSPFDNVSAAVARALEERRTLWLSEAIVDARPSASMSEWTTELDEEARAIHGDLVDATHRALGDD